MVGRSDRRFPNLHVVPSQFQLGDICPRQVTESGHVLPAGFFSVSRACSKWPAFEWREKARAISWIATLRPGVALPPPNAPCKWMRVYTVESSDSRSSYNTNNNNGMVKSVLIIRGASGQWQFSETRSRRTLNIAKNRNTTKGNTFDKERILRRYKAIKLMQSI